MAKLWVFVLVTAPFQVPIFWAAGWLVIDTFRERRIARAAAAESVLWFDEQALPPPRG